MPEGGLLVRKPWQIGTKPRLPGVAHPCYRAEMEINEEHIRDLMEVYKRAYRIELTHDEARQMLQRLIFMFEELSRRRRRSGSTAIPPIR